MENKLEKRNLVKIFESLPVSLALSVAIIVLAVSYSNNLKGQPVSIIDTLEAQVLPEEGIALPVIWGDLGAQLVDAGVIDEQKFIDLYQNRGQFSEEYENLLISDNQNYLKINKENASYLLNLFWALGLANKNEILDEGPMMDPRYKGAGNFASTGGWTLAKGPAMSHYSKHDFITLTTEQQVLVDKVSKDIYRPCCNNATYFPDCNHGMAMLGLLELLAANGVEEQEIYQLALEVNTLWFPDHYNNVGRYLEIEGIEVGNLSAKDILGINYSSASAANKIAASLKPQQSSGGSCGV